MRLPPADTDTHADQAAPLVRWLAGTGIGAVCLCAALLAYLHVAGPTAQLSPVRRTISEYALLETGYIFNVAVLALAAGSLAVLVALAVARLVGWYSGGALAMVLWCAGLVGVVLFEKHNWAVGPSVNGDIHRLAGLVAFVSLPVAALLIGRSWLHDPRWGRHAGCSVAAGMVSLLCFAPIAIAFLTEPWTGVPWWRAIPLGAVERLLGLSELAAVVVLGTWALCATSPATRSRGRAPRNA
ncbi:MAG TPA: DUF998 domain-containing protein [Micromonosporaceae bacterium]|nr:DUF998 domain-containing protein [Micromonosporaceae bacterium]